MPITISIGVKMSSSITPGPFPPRKFSKLLRLLLTDEEPWCTQSYHVAYSFIGFDNDNLNYCSMFGEQTCQMRIVFPAPHTSSRMNACTPLGDDCEEVFSERSL